MHAPPVTPAALAAAFAAALVASAVNAVAGGGTLVSFPVLVALGLPPVLANATSTVGIWPGSLGSAWGFRRELARAGARARGLVAPSLAGGAAGALLLRATSPAAFDRVVPWLVLLATVLFAARGPLQERLRGRAGAGERSGGAGRATGALLAAAVGIYGGYFGAGMSIMNLAVLGLMGMTDLLEMNALTSLLSLCVNGVAIALFAAAGLVDWPVAAAMAAGALVGGYGAAGLARRVGRRALGRLVVAVGVLVTAAFFARQLGLGAP